jgi:hypothetical protein
MPLQVCKPIACAVAIAMLGSGCEMLGLVTTGSEGTHTAGLPPIVTSPEAVQLEFVIIERPWGDPLFGAALWNQLDQIGALEPAARMQLLEHGIRVGNTGSAPPGVLETLLELDSQELELPSLSESRGQKRSLVALRAGHETEVPPGQLWNECVVNVPAGSDRSVRSYQQAQFLFRVKAVQSQKGWASIEFLPEVHHGTVQTRHTPTPGGWVLRTGQNTEPMFPIRFELTLAERESAIVGLAGDDPTSVGYHLFGSPPGGSAVQRLLVVRVADTAKVNVVRAE